MEETQPTIEQPMPPPPPPEGGFPIEGVGIISGITALITLGIRKWTDDRKRRQETEHAADLIDERNEHSVVIELLRQSSVTHKELFKLLNAQAQNMQQHGGAIREMSTQLQQFANSLKGKITDSYTVRPIPPKAEVTPEFSKDEVDK